MRAPGTPRAPIITQLTPGRFGKASQFQVVLEPNLIDVIRFLFWGDDCQQQIEWALSGRRKTSSPGNDETELNGEKRTDIRRYYEGRMKRF